MAQVSSVSEEDEKQKGCACRRQEMVVKKSEPETSFMQGNRR